jgi:hypothetical protein
VIIGQSSSGFSRHVGTCIAGWEPIPRPDRSPIVKQPPAAFSTREWRALRTTERWKRGAVRRRPFHPEGDEAHRAAPGPFTREFR